MSDSHSKRLLGAFIRAHREQLPPKSGGRRRTPGWRREELAEAALVSVTWITWLEQGRDVAASPAALSRLAEALRLTPAERVSLFDLAGKRDPQAVADARIELPSELLALPTQFNGPAYLLDASWTAQAWNASAGELFTGWLGEVDSERNLLRFVFLNSDAKTLLADWPERARRLAAEFRADFSRRPRDNVLQSLIDELLAASPAFAGFWQEQAVLHREGGERRFNHPQRGPLRYLQTTLLVAAQPDCKLCVCAAADMDSSPSLAESYCTENLYGAKRAPK